MLYFLLGGAAPADAATNAPDRLDRFRRLAESRLSAAEMWGQALSEDVRREIYDLLDDEIVESLRSGSVFASQAFLQDRLDAFHEAWGGTAFRVVALPGGDLVVGTFQLSPSGDGNSVRIYDRSQSGAGLVRTLGGEGVPVLQELPTTQKGEPQFLVAWLGPQSSRGTSSLRLELWRSHGDGIAPVWSTDSLVDGDLLVSGFALGAREVSFRYEVRYPGWKPGCAGQTEQEDLYRYVAARDTFVLVRRRVHNGWHREFHADLARFLSALNARDERALATLVGDGALRRRLPASLEADLACDEANGPGPSSVSVAAVTPRDGRPWTLVFRRTRDGWRLARAVPVEPVSAKMTR